MASSLTFHEVYGTVSKAQLRAYKRHNVSQSDHDSLVDHYGELGHDLIVKAVSNPKYLQGSSFSVFLWHQDVAPWFA